jgi:hypothetical protein
MLSVPIATLVWSVLCFTMAASVYCLQKMGTSIGRRLLLGSEIGGSVVALFVFLLVVVEVDIDINSAKYGVCRRYL